jgi:hypothetical protein
MNGVPLPASIRARARGGRIGRSLELHLCPRRQNECRHVVPAVIRRRLQEPEMLVQQFQGMKLVSTPFDM